MRRKLLLIAAFCFISLLKGFSQNNALHFDGTNDFVTIPASGTNLTSFSIEAWINPETIASDMALVNTDAWATGSVHFQFLGGKLMLSLNGLNTAETSGDWPKMTTNPTVNVWQHIAMTYDGVAKKIIFYLNGVESGSYNTPTMPVANLTNATIGGWYGGRLYKGSMDEFRIWNKALTSADINANMKSELVGTESGLIAYYNFNQGVANGANNTATSLLDKTSNHFNGTLTNFDLGYTSNWIERAAGNNCLQFDGVDDYVDISATDAPNFSAGISITGYIKWNKFNSWSRIIDMGTGPGPDNILIANNSTSSNLTFSIRKGGAETQITSQTTFSPNQWYYIACTVSAAGEAKIYVNGVLDKSATGFNLPNTLVRTKQYIGKSNWSSDAYFNGCIDNLSIWNKTLTQAEVTTGATDFVGNEAGLLHYYRFNQGTTAGNNTTVTTLTDAVTAGKKDGALNNFTLQPTGISNWTAGFVIPSAPGAPTGVTALAGNLKATVSFTPPTSNGGSPITSYTVTSNPGSKTGTGTQCPIAVTGLTPGQAYTFTVVASNAFGSSVASSASAPVTPFSAPIPIVTSVAVPTNGYYKTGDALTFTVNFDIPETVTGNPSLTIGLNTGGNVAAAYVSGSGTSSLAFRYTVAEGNIDDDGITIGAIDLNGGTIQSAAGADADLTLKNVAATTGIKVDAVAPKQISINLPTQARIMGQDIEFVTNFNDNVIVNTTLGVPFMQLMIGASTARANYVSGSGTQQIIFRYTVANNDYDADGIGAILNVQLNGATFKDATGNNVVFMSLPNTFIPLASVKVDGVVPTITSVSTPANGNFITGQPLTFTMNFNEPVVVATSGGNPYINLTIGNNTVIAAYVSGSGTSALVFSYTVASGDLDIDGISIASSITANGATLKDVNGNNAVLTFAAPNLSDFYVNVKVPTVTTQAVTTITSTTAIGNGNITDLGTPNPIQYGIVWSTASNPTVALSTKTEQGVATATGSFTSTIANLMPLKQYFVKAYATNSAGTSYGDEVSFTTLDAVPNAPTDVVATAGVLQATVSFTAPVSNGGSAITGYTVTASPGGKTATGTASPLTITGLTNGTSYTFTVVATNAQGNSNPSSASAPVTPFVDTEKPVITGMPSNVSVSTDAGKSYAIVTWTAPSATDNIGVTSFTTNHAIGSQFAVGTTTITYTATDAAGNTETANFTVTVSDSEKPVISNMPTNISVSTDAGKSYATVSWTEPTAIDNVGITSLSYDPRPAGFIIGTTTITYTAVDAVGNKATASFTVTVNDSEKPVISNIPANISVNTDAGKNYATVTWIEPAASDNVGVTSFTTNHAIGSQFTVGTTTVSYTATDAVGNLATASFTVTVTDIEKPIISDVPTNITVSTDAGKTYATVSWIAPTATDNVGVTSFTTDHAIGSQFNVGITTVTYTATDASENTATASFTVTVTSATGIDQLSKTSINVYPNPVVDLLSISTGNTCDSGLYSIISVLGTIEVSGTISNGKAIVNVSRLSRGTYIVRVQIGNIGTNHSIIKR